METVRKHFDELLQDLREKVVEMGVLAESAVGDSVEALIHKDGVKAQQVLERDNDLDRMELELHSTCLVLIARESPVAHDLRLIGSAMTTATEFERVGDDAVSIAKKALTLPGDFPRAYAQDLQELSERSRAMLREAIQAFAEDRTDRLDAIIVADAEVDQIWKRVRRRLKEDIRQHPDFVDVGFKLMQAFHHLEYVGDHAVSIAERLEFVQTGNLARFSRVRF